MDTAAWGARLRALRERRRLSQEQLATLTGVSVSMISRLERAEREPSLRLLEQLAPGYRLTVPALAAAILGTGEEPASPAPLPDDPLQLLTIALDRGPWPQNVSAAVYALLANIAYNRRQAAAEFRAAIADILAQAPEAPYHASGEEVVVRAPGDRPPTGREWLALQLEALYQRLYAGTTD